MAETNVQTAYPLPQQLYVQCERPVQRRRRTLFISEQKVLNVRISVFKCGETELETVIQHSYLQYIGLLLNEHLDYNVTVRYVTKAGNPALELIIVKNKAFGGLPEIFPRSRSLYPERSGSQWHGPASSSSETVEISCKCMVSTRICGSGETHEAVSFLWRSTFQRSLGRSENAGVISKDILGINLS